MFQRREKPVNRKRMFIRLYVTVMSLILVSSLFGILRQSAAAQTAPAAPAAVIATDLEEPAVPLAPEAGRTVQRQEVYSRIIPAQVRLCADPSLPAGKHQVLSQGSPGQLQVTAEFTYRDGKEIGRTVLEEKVVRSPKTRIIGVGTGEEPAAADPGPVIQDGYIWLPTGEVLTYTGTDTIRATAYTHTDPGCDYITATQTPVRKGTVAVDPRYIPYGTRMFLTSSDGSYVYGIAVAEDCGGAIKGDRMDLYFPTYEECRQFGRKVCTIYYLG